MVVLRWIACSGIVLLVLMRIVASGLGDEEATLYISQPDDDLHIHLSSLYRHSFPGCPRARSLPHAHPLSLALSLTHTPLFPSRGEMTDGHALPGLVSHCPPLGSRPSPETAIIAGNDTNSTAWHGTAQPRQLGIRVSGACSPKKGPLPTPTHTPGHSPMNLIPSSRLASY